MMIRMEGLGYSLPGPQGRLTLLDSINLAIHPGEVCAMTGASGSGKTTLLSLMGLLDQPVTGQYWLDGQATGRLGPDQAAAIRNRLIGFVFQAFHLLPRLSALDNVALPLLYRGLPRARRLDQACAALELVGLAGRATDRPAELSGGQCQRVAIARALVGQPRLLLADEPTGNLDSITAHEIMDLLLSLNARLGLTLVIVTHDPALAARCCRQITLQDGRIITPPHAGPARTMLPADNP